MDRNKKFKEKFWKKMYEKKRKRILEKIESNNQDIEWILNEEKKKQKETERKEGNSTASE